MSKLTIVPHANPTGPVISAEALRVGRTGLPLKTEESIARSKEKLASEARDLKKGEKKANGSSGTRNQTTQRALGAATSSIANMSAVVKESGPFGPIASVLVPVLAASFAVYLYMSAGEGGISVEGEKGKRTLFRWLDVIIGVVVAAAVLSFAR